jgi:hypothetical protein
MKVVVIYFLFFLLPISIIAQTCTVTATNSSTNANNCAGTTITLSASTVASAQSYNWVGPNGYTATGQTVTIPSAQISNAGTYIVQVTGSSSCSGVTTVDINETPTINPVSNSPVCVGSPLIFNSGAPAGALVAWTGPGFAAINSNPTISSPQLINSGNYTVTVLHNGCQLQQVIPVVINPKPILNISDTTMNFCAGQVFPGQALNAPNSTINWYNSNLFMICVNMYFA